ncbi:DUF3105 domain-containing protein [Candidatus Gracilibacteria bacterium]|nr:DUF3105 domain-containing protein [Candidatus Gracilibacteria bacterium]
MGYSEDKLSKKEKQAERSHLAAKKQKLKSMKSFLMWGLLLVVVIGGLSFIISKATVERQGVHHTIQGSEHIVVGGAHAAYTTNPPTSGDHHANAARWGIYDSSLPDEQLVHNLEHGGIWISYKTLGEGELAQLEDFANDHSQSVILTPRAANDSNIAFTSWGRLLEMDVLDMGKLELFYKGNKNRSPEPLAGR